ncbi:MAG: hypothetical protein J5982_02180 [Bacilli bacterium]|nr:hypothetical protein [Bacilli bacterium]
MEYIFSYLIILMVLFLAIYIFDFAIKHKNNSLGTQKSFQYIVRKYDLKMNKERVRLLSKIICFVNAFIISIPIAVIIILDIDYYVSLFISFALFIVLILVCYNIIGSILKKKGW